MEINLINIIPFNKNNFSSSIFSNNIYIYIYDEEIIFNISMASKNSLHFYDEIIVRRIKIQKICYEIEKY